MNKLKHHKNIIHKLMFKETAYDKTILALKTP